MTGHGQTVFLVPLTELVCGYVVERQFTAARSCLTIWIISIVDEVSIIVHSVTTGILTFIISISIWIDATGATTRHVEMEIAGQRDFRGPSLAVRSQTVQIISMTVFNQYSGTADAHTFNDGAELDNLRLSNLNRPLDG